MSVINGKDLIVKIGDDKIVCSTSATLNVNQATIEASCKDSGGWINAVAGSKDWTISADGLYDLHPGTNETSFDDLFDDLVAGTAVEIIFGGADTGDAIYTGAAYIVSTSLTGANDEIASFSAEFKGNGALTKSTVT